MKALTTLIVAGLFANAAIAAPTPASAAGATQVGASGATAAAPVDAANVPTVTISKHRSRDEVRAEAVQAMKNHKTALAIQLEQYQ